MAGDRPLDGKRGEAAPVVIVTGPTASGKSALALALARAFEGEVINADAMQIYRELEILTARPGPEALAQAPHRLYGVLSGREACSAGRWCDLALEAIEEAREAGRLPILVGGTGLYFKALREGLAPLPAIPAAVRAAARQALADIGPEALHGALAARDPAMAARLRPSDSQRLVRAWEVLEATGRSLAAWQEDAAAEAAPYRYLEIVVLPPREALYAACNARFEAMMAAGALAEVEALLALGLDPALPVMKALGVPELVAVLRGELAEGEAIARAQRATRHYAKRQITWLRTQGALARAAAEEGAGEVKGEYEPRNNDPILIIDSQYSAQFEPKVFNFIRRRVLTLQK